MKEKAQVILYTRPGCHLCEEMKQQIRSADCAELYVLEEVNIESGAALLERYQHDIPVLLIEGIEAFKHRLRAEEFRAYLEKSLG